MLSRASRRGLRPALSSVQQKSAPAFQTSVIRYRIPSQDRLVITSNRCHHTIATSTLPNSPSQSLPQHEKPPFMLTTPIFYVNGEPHIGHLYTVIIADVIARWKRQNGYDVHFMVGTDEHGAKVEEAAIKAGYASTQEFCDMISKKFKDCWSMFDIVYDDYARTTSDDHKQQVHNFWNYLVEKGFIYKGVHQGWYCRADEAFIPESRLLPIEDEKGKRFVTTLGHPVEWVEEENYKFKMSLFKEHLEKWLTKSPPPMSPKHRLGEVLTEVKDGMEDVSVSRLTSKVKWAIPVPNDPEHSIYVWTDALNIYITSAWRFYTQRMNAMKDSSSPNINEGKEEETRNIGQMEDEKRPLYPPVWPPSLMLLGKDITWFHSAYLPSMLMATMDNDALHTLSSLHPTPSSSSSTIPPLHPTTIPLPQHLLTHSHWLADGKKMSKSLGNVVSPTVLAKFGSDNVRYALMKTGGFKDDLNFIVRNICSLINADISDNYGNLAMRGTSPTLLPDRKFPLSQDEVIRVIEESELLMAQRDQLKQMTEEEGKDSERILDELAVDCANGVDPIPDSPSSVIDDFSPSPSSSSSLSDSTSVSPSSAQSSTASSTSSSLTSPSGSSSSGAHSGSGGPVSLSVETSYLEKMNPDPLPGMIVSELDVYLQQLVKSRIAMTRKLYDCNNIERALHTILHLLKACNAYVILAQPWTLRSKDPKDQCPIKEQRIRVIQYHNLELVRCVSLLLLPVIPRAATAVLDACGYLRTNGNLHTSITEQQGVDPNHTNINKIKVDETHVLPDWQAMDVSKPEGWREAQLKLMHSPLVSPSNARFGWAPLTRSDCEIGFPCPPASKVSEKELEEALFGPKEVPKKTGKKQAKKMEKKHQALKAQKEAALSDEEKKTNLDSNASPA